MQKISSKFNFYNFLEGWWLLKHGECLLLLGAKMLLRLFRGVGVLRGHGQFSGDRCAMHESCHGHRNESRMSHNNVQ